MPLHHYVTLGRSGLRVSPLCLGAMTLGQDWSWGADEATSHRLLDEYTAAGGNFIDTANIYTKGHSEKIIGDWLGRPGAGVTNRRRDRLVLATKFMGNMYLGDPNGGGGGRKSILGACEQSLRRLRTDYIDLYLMHFWDALTPIDETLRAVDDLVRAGKVRYLGFSDTPAWKCAEAQTLARLRDWSPVIALQIEYSLLERTVEHDLIPMAIEMGMGVTPWSPLKGGILTGKHARDKAPAEGRGTSEWVRKQLTDRADSVIAVLKAIAREIDSTPARVAIAWAQGRPGVASTIIGARTLEQLHDNLAALDVRLSPEHLGRLGEASEPPPVFPHQFLRNVATVQRGAVIDGHPSEPWGMAPQNDAERY